MFLISVEKLQPGMTLAKSLYSADGSALLYEGVKLTPGCIAKLESLGIVSVYIHIDCLRDIEIEDLVAEETRVKVLCLTRQAMEAAKVRDVFAVEELEDQIDDILHDLLANEELLIHLTDIRTQRDYTFGHSVNVCIISLIIGIALGYTMEQLHTLGLGALLHDIGKGKIPPEILDKPDRLSSEEFAVMQEHSRLGFDMLKANDDIDLAASLVALQHHERYDGTGYPWNLKGEEISEFARVVAVADVYDALTTDRVYRHRFLPCEALDMIEKDAGEKFDPTIVKAFRKFVAVYPIGCMVQLNTGKYAVVVKVPPRIPKKPVVRVVENHEGTCHSEEIDLRQVPEYYIKKIIRQ
jgi:HD-GYP domain-containing protein (c-di-GMP phosphodiesterase class II)